MSEMRFIDKGSSEYAANFPKQKVWADRQSLHTNNSADFAVLEQAKVALGALTKLHRLFLHARLLFSRPHAFDSIQDYWFCPQIEIILSIESTY